MSTFSAVLRSAFPLVQPTEQESKTLRTLTGLLIARAKKASSKFPEVRGMALGGSLAKGTWLPGHADIDIFVKIDPATGEDRFERIGLDVGKAATRGFPRGKKYAQHPYTEATVDGVRVNIVPCYAVQKMRWQSAADRSLFHVKLVGRLPERQKMQVKLLKRFMIAIGVYGAEIETRGFSGYAAEVLVIKKRSLIGVLRHFARLRGKGDKRLFELLDPVDPSRDLATAVSGEKLGLMILAAREFLRRPSKAFFERMSGSASPSLKTDVICVVFEHSRLSEDTLWGELRKTLKHIVRHSEVRGFKIARAMAASNNRDRSAFLLIPEFRNLPLLEQRVGPTVDREKETEAFISTNSKKAKLVWVDDDARVRLLQQRDYTDLSVLLADAVRGKSESIGASDELARGMRRSAKVLQGAPLLHAASAAEWMKDGIDHITRDAFGTR